VKGTRLVSSKTLKIPTWFLSNFKVFSPVPLMMSRKTTPAHHIQPTYRAFLVFELWLACCANPAMHLDGHQLDCPEDGCGGKLNSMCWKRRWVCELDGSHSLHSFKKYECSTCGHSCQGIDPRILKSLPPHVRNLVLLDLLYLMLAVLLLLKVSVFHYKLDQFMNWQQFNNYEGK